MVYEIKEAASAPTRVVSIIKNSLPIYFDIYA